MINLLVSLTLAYLIGSIPTSFIFAKILKKVDLREHGSGNVGATNVFRVVGKLPAIFVLILDIFKGIASVAFLPDIFFNNAIEHFIGLEFYSLLVGLFVISGHIWSVFLKFRGGKGVATTAGVLIMLAPKVLAASAIVWVLVFLACRIVSVASIASAMFLPVFAIVFEQPIHLVLFCVLLSVLGTFKHKANIKRLLRGEEKKLFLVILSLCFAVTSYAREINLYEMFKDAPHIKIYLNEVTTRVGHPRVKIDEFKNIFKNVLRERLNIEFVHVNSAAEAALIVTGEIKKYVFSERVMPSFFGIAAVVRGYNCPQKRSPVGRRL